MDDVFVARELTLARADGDIGIRLELHQPIEVSGSFQCKAVIIVDGSQRFEAIIHGEDGLQALKLALKSADQKIKALGAELNGHPRYLDASIPPVFDELESLDRLSGSRTNLHDALKAAIDSLKDTAASSEERRAIARRLAPVLESGGILDLDGVHLRDKQEEDWGRGWSELKLAAGQPPAGAKKPAKKQQSKRSTSAKPKKNTPFK